MKKFDRLPPETRKEEIQSAALSLFLSKGFAATTMENIVGAVSLSKGGVYRLYSSTAAILTDLIVAGMHLRNQYYEDCICRAHAAGEAPSASLIANMIVDSLFLYPEYSSLYVEFLWEKQRNPQLEDLYERICRQATKDTILLIRKYSAESLLLLDERLLDNLLDIMNGAILSMKVLKLEEKSEQFRDILFHALLSFMTDGTP